MGLPDISPMDQVFAEALNTGDGARKIHRRLFGQGGLPSERTVQNWIVKARSLPPDQQADYRLVLWPETFERGELPWEAAASVADLMRQFEPGRRPPVKLAQWYWRLRQFAPPELDVLPLALAMAARAPGSGGDGPRWVEAQVLGWPADAWGTVTEPDHDYLDLLRGQTQ